MGAKPPPKVTEVAEKWNRLFESLRNESDYICAIVGAAFIDHLLYSMLGMSLTSSSTSYG